MRLVAVATLLSLVVVAHGHALERENVRILLIEDAPSITVTAKAALTVEGEGASIVLAPGAYSFRALEATPAVETYHLFTRTFEPDDTVELETYLETTRNEGFDPKVVTLGRAITLPSGGVADTRVIWVSLQREDSAESAEAARKELALNGHNAWIQAERLAPGHAFVRVSAHDGTALASFDAPLSIRSQELVIVEDVRGSLWSDAGEPRAYAGELRARVNGVGRLELVEALPVEEYLRGVLPAEMHFSWPAEGLKAQAVAARSDVMAGLGGRYALQRFDFFATERSRAYLGASGYTPPTDDAVGDTTGEILLAGDRIATTVFSAVCGGWTENNDTVWYGPPDSALRGIADFAGGDTPIDSPAADPAAWLDARPGAYCAIDEKYFRWVRRYTETELRGIINAHETVGRIEGFDVGDRGVSGRLKWLRVRGSEATVTVHKELPIRRLLGRLPSAFFVVEQSTDASGELVFTFRGGGRGHGVGLCQQGARAMAELGHAYDDILHHYFTGVSLARCTE